jgi:hypothetical protein
MVRSTLEFSMQINEYDCGCSNRDHNPHALRNVPGAGEVGDQPCVRSVSVKCAVATINRYLSVPTPRLPFRWVGESRCYRDAGDQPA